MRVLPTVSWNLWRLWQDSLVYYCIKLINNRPPKFKEPLQQDNMSKAMFKCATEGRQSVFIQPQEVTPQENINIDHFTLMNKWEMLLFFWWGVYFMEGTLQTFCQVAVTVIYSSLYILDIIGLTNPEFQSWECYICQLTCDTLEFQFWQNLKHDEFHHWIPAFKMTQKENETALLHKIAKLYTNLIVFSLNFFETHAHIVLQNVSSSFSLSNWGGSAPVWHFRETPTFSLFVYQATISIVIKGILSKSRADVATFNPLIELPGRSRARVSEGEGVKLHLFYKHSACWGCF